MQYTSLSRNGRHLDLMNEEQITIGTMDFGYFQYHTADIAVVDHNTYRIAPVSFWNLSMEIVKNGVPFGLISYNWGVLDIKLENGRTLYFRRKSFWNNNYIVHDEQGNEVALLDTGFRWKDLSYFYAIDVYPNALDKETNLLLPFVLIYSTRYLRMRS
jgi:hypothetical protein